MNNEHSYVLILSDVTDTHPINSSHHIENNKVLLFTDTLPPPLLSSSLSVVDQIPGFRSMSPGTVPYCYIGKIETGVPNLGGLRSGLRSSWTPDLSDLTLCILETPDLKPDLPGLLVDPWITIPGTKSSTRIHVQCEVNSLHNFTFSTRTVQRK